MIMSFLIENIVNFLESILINHGFWGVFFTFFIAQVIAPIPTELLTLATGFLFLGDFFSLDFFKILVFSISIPAALGTTIGSLFVYYIGYFLGKPFLEKWGKFFNLSWREVEKIQAKFEKSHMDETALFSLRVIPFFPMVSVSFVGGLIRFKLKPYLIFTFLGVFVRIIILSFLGWQVGGFYKSYAAFFKGLERIGLILILLLLAVFILYRFKKRKQNEA